MNKKGNFLINMFMVVLAMIFFIALIPALVDSFNIPRGCSYLNCAGYVDADASGEGCSATNKSYLPSLETHSLSCTAVDLGIPLLILGVLFAGIMIVIYNKPQTPAPEPYY